MRDTEIFLHMPCLDAVISARVLRAGTDLCVLVSGGHSPHAGSVSLGVPRKSLAGEGADSATVSTLNVTGHKDDAIGSLFAKRLAGLTGGVVSVTCGIHFDNADEQALESIVRTAQTLLDAVEQELLARDA